MQYPDYHNFTYNSWIYFQAGGQVINITMQGLWITSGLSEITG